MRVFEPGELLRNPVTGAWFVVVEHAHAVVLRRVTLGPPSAVPAAVAARYERDPRVGRDGD